MRKRILSGAQPTGSLHIGNYLGALKNWVALQDEYEAFYCIVNLHAITLPQDPKTLRQKTLDLARIYLAAGVDPEKSTIFIQSDVPEHAELTWVLSCQARMGELERMTQFKDKSQKFGRPNWFEMISKAIPASEDHPLSSHGTESTSEKQPSSTPETDATPNVKGGLSNSSAPKQRNYARMYENLTEERLKEILERTTSSRVSVGLFTYPVLMAADILLYQADLVPVGQDQKQHLELTRDLAERFNRDFGETFKIPEPYIPKAGASIKSLQDPAKKMSKSDENLNGSIFLLDDADTITKKIKRAVTDSGTTIEFDESRPAIANLLTIYQLLTGKSAEECVAHFEGKGYGHFKTELAETTVEFLRPFQERVRHYDDETLKNILKAGAKKARSVAGETLRSVYAKTGIAE